MSDFELPNTRYALSSDVNIAFQVMGDGPIDIIMVPGVVSHIDFLTSSPDIPGFCAVSRRLPAS
jgi:hypothetical protein